MTSVFEKKKKTFYRDFYIEKTSPFLATIITKDCKLFLLER